MSNKLNRHILISTGKSQDWNITHEYVGMFIVDYQGKVKVAIKSPDSVYWLIIHPTGDVTSICPGSSLAKAYKIISPVKEVKGE